MPKHGSIRKVYACLAVTCHLHFWQNDRDLLRATAVAQGWNRYRNKSQHRKLTLDKKIIPPLQKGFEPATFRSRVRRSNHWAIPAHSRCSLVACMHACSLLSEDTGGLQHITYRQAVGQRGRLHSPLILSVCLGLVIWLLVSCHRYGYRVIIWGLSHVCICIHHFCIFYLLICLHYCYLTSDSFSLLSFS